MVKSERLMIKIKLIKQKLSISNGRLRMKSLIVILFNIFSKSGNSRY